MKTAIARACAQTCALACALLAAGAQAAPTVLIGNDLDSPRYRTDYTPAAGDPGARLQSDARNSKVTQMTVITQAFGDNTLRPQSFSGSALAVVTRSDTGLADAEATLVINPARGGVASPTPPAQAQAQTSYFNGRVRTDTMRTIALASSVPPDNLNCGPAGAIVPCSEVVDTGLHQRHSARTRSLWIDTWTARNSGWVEMDVKVHARLKLDLHALNGSNRSLELTQVRAHHDSDGFLMPVPDEATLSNFFPGDYEFELQNFSLFSQLAVFDLSRPGTCSDVNPDCDSDFTTYASVAGRAISAFGRVEVEGEQEIEILRSEIYQSLLEDGEHEIDLLLKFGFMAEDGKSYRVVGDTRVESENGIDIDGFSTFSLQNLTLAAGLEIDSEAVRRFGAVLPGAPGAPGGTVPVPSTLALLLAAALVGRFRPGARVGSRAGSRTG